LKVAREDAPLIAHVIYRLGVGGLENGLVNLINRLPESRYRHVIISLTDISEFKLRITRTDVECIALQKRAGNDVVMLWRLWQLFRRLRPSIVHSRNLAALEAQFPAWLAGVPCRIHGEHGRDVSDMDGTSLKYCRIRRLYKPLVHRYVPLSHELSDYLRQRVGVAERKIRHICNGVDVDVFRPADRAGRSRVMPAGFAEPDAVVFGTVGRLEAIKDQLTLVRAFGELCRIRPGDQCPRLIIVGNGSMREQLVAVAENEGVLDRVWLAGSRDDVVRLMSAMDVFILPSLAEGISNTILEAMACGLPVVATRVGGNAELVVEGETGLIVPRADSTAMAQAMQRYLDDGALGTLHGAAGRARVVEHFSIAGMVNSYQDLYDECLPVPG
jgi:sugar transferase (PEP-CTERM/EpsH1 system associated)